MIKRCEICGEFEQVSTRCCWTASDKQCNFLIGEIYKLRSAQNKSLAEWALEAKKALEYYRHADGISLKAREALAKFPGERDE